MSLQDRLIDAFRWHEGHADVWGWFRDPALFAAVVGALAEPLRPLHVTKIVAVEARGFLLGGPVAIALGAGFVAVRKDGALFAGRHVAATTAPDYRGRQLRLRVQRDALGPGDRVAIVDDWAETGSQSQVVRGLAEAAGAAYVGASIVVDQLPPTARAALAPVHALLRADQLPGA